jgi:glutaminyl-peptide cyclotransferase
VRALAATLLAIVLTAEVAAASSFSGEAAVKHVERLVAIGPRVAGSAGGAKARDYIVSELKKAGLEVRVEPFEALTPHGRLRMANVVAVIPGRRADVILIGGHYDTKWFSDRHFVGANDGGSSAAFLIELARQLARTPQDFTYWVVFFDGEEARQSWTATDSLYGSRRMAADLSRSRRLPRAVIVIDMIGDRDLNIRREVFSTGALTDLIWKTAMRLGYDRHFLSTSMPVEDDHAPFLREGVPAALLIDFDFPPWHTADDTLDKVSPQSLKVVGDVLLEALPSIERWLLGSPLRRP